MLNSIHIQNFAISSEAEVEIEPGMTVLTGETGAGKSILIDALDLVLGDRADASVVRHGTERATINASFTLADNSPALDWLRQQALDEGDECHLRRVISAEGRSKAFINNSPANLGALKTLASLLIEIHGQHEHQSLMKTARQRQLLDSAGDHGEPLAQVARLSKSITQLNSQLAKLQHDIQDNEAQIELLKYQTEEMSALHIADLDIPALLQEHEQLANVDTLRQLSYEALQQLTNAEDSNINDQMNRLLTQLEPWLETSDELKSAHGLLQDVSALVQEAASSLQQVQDRLESDPQRLTELDSLLGQLHELARKHHVQLEALPDLFRDKQQQLETLYRRDADISDLENELQELQGQYLEYARQLHARRLATAERLSTAVTDNMQSLGMQGGRFEIRVQSTDKTDSYAEHGRDEVSFYVSANPGQPLLPLNKVASGGELSRISLAITVICAGSNNADTMIFDEVDSGIGGGVAEIVGRQLLSLGQDRQVLCVTHLPQVAAQAHHHYRVVKTSTDTHTESRVIRLDDDARVQEIARMLGGVDITDQSLAHAKELLDTRHTAEAG